MLEVHLIKVFKSGDSTVGKRITTAITYTLTQLLCFSSAQPLGWWVSSLHVPMVHIYSTSLTGIWNLPFNTGSKRLRLSSEKRPFIKFYSPVLRIEPKQLAISVTQWKNMLTTTYMFLLVWKSL